jgi:hypothetical protein
VETNGVTGFDHLLKLANAQLRGVDGGYCTKVQSHDLRSLHRHLSKQFLTLTRQAPPDSSWETEASTEFVKSITKYPNILKNDSPDTSQ